VDLSSFPKRYNGNSQALALKASSALVQTRPKTQITNLHGKNIGIPEDVFKDAVNLISLWRRKAPELDKQISKHHHGPGSSGGVKKKKNSPQSIAKSSKNRGRSRGVAKGTSKKRSHPRDDRGAIEYLVMENEGYTWVPT
jgi:hypothetical protein